jgi:hypothetical protein
VLLGSAPFNHQRAPVLWLDARDRRLWAERIFTAVAPLLEIATPARDAAAR